MMIRHLVLFGFRERARLEGVEETVAALRRSAATMIGKIPGLLKCELTLNLASGGPGDLVFYSEFESPEALAAYQGHPLHVDHKSRTAEYVEHRGTVDIQADDEEDISMERVG